MLLAPMVESWVKVWAKTYLFPTKVTVKFGRVTGLPKLVDLFSQIIIRARTPINMRGGLLLVKHTGQLVQINGRGQRPPQGLLSLGASMVFTLCFNALQILLLGLLIRLLHTPLTHHSTIS